MACTMESLDVNPCYRDLFERHGIQSAGDFLELPGVIVSGHPDRHVVRVQIGTGPDAVAAFLKREHRVTWKDRILNAWAGVGPVSKSQREANTLRAVREAAIEAPEWMAAGEDARGRSFVLVRAISQSIDLPQFLGRKTLTATQRRRFARALGQAIARLHNAGFDQPDLYAKHVLVSDGGDAIRFLDWQRSRRHHFVPWRTRYRDLAALHATLETSLLSDGERLLCLRAYLRACRIQRVACPDPLLRSTFQILRWEHRLLRRRHVREMRRAEAGANPQTLVWLDGEALCATPHFLDEVNGMVPDALTLDRLPPNPPRIFEQTQMTLPGGKSGVLVRQRTFHPWRAWWVRLRRTRPTTPEVLLAGLLFRLQRQAIRCPRLLAFGQRRAGADRVESFLLTELSADAPALPEYFDHAPLSERRRRIREAATLLRRLDEAGYAIDSSENADALLWIENGPEQPLALTLAGVQSLYRPRRFRRRPIGISFAAAEEQFGLPLTTRTDRLRFLLAFLKQRRLRAADRKIARQMLDFTVGRRVRRTFSALRGRLSRRATLRPAMAPSGSRP
jgi:tRNA A-37 threonylcarbamoyl transferase component Bud32